MNDSATRFNLLLAGYQQEARIEGEYHIALTHLLADLIEWCDAKRLDLDLEVENAREMLLEAGNGH